MPHDDPQRPPSTTGQLFLPLKFWVAHRIPERSGVLQALTNNGGVVVKFEKDADYCLVDPAAKLLPTGRMFYDYKYIDDSLNIGQLQDPDDYRVQLPTAADRPVGSRSLAGKSTRARFTPQDDQLLYNWIVPYRDNGGRWKGNEIYQQLERKYPHHPYQSWRSRFIVYVQYQKLHVTENIDPFDEIANSGAGAEQDLQRSPKRRRLNDLRSTNGATTTVRSAPMPGQARTPEPAASAIAREPSAPAMSQQQQVNLSFTDGTEPEVPARQAPTPGGDVHVVDLEIALPAESHTTMPNTENVELTPRDAQRQSLSVKAWRSMRKAFPTLTWTEGDRLYKAVPYIYGSNPDDRKTCFQNMAKAGEWDRHSAEQWQTYYNEAMLPEYMRRNGLRDEEELEAFVTDALAREVAQREQTPEIKREPSPDPRSPAERQRQIELERARAETEDIAFSETSSDSQDEPDAVPAGEEKPFGERRPLHAVEPQLRTAQRTIVHANEGRKRASQQTNSTQSESQLIQASQPPTIPPKKKLFGQTLSSSQSGGQAGTQTDMISMSINASFVSHHSSASDEPNRAPVTSSLSSVPTVQRPPESYQLPPKSASTSQESAQLGTANRSQVAAGASTKESMISVENQLEQRAASTPPRAKSPSIDLLGDGDLDDDDGRSQGALSDTGSEYMAFDTAPERSQLWETAADYIVEGVDEAVDDQEQETTGESDGDEEDVAVSGEKSTIERPPTPIRSRVVFKDIESDDEEITNEPDACSMQHKEAYRPSTTDRIETQALFEYNENDVSEFDLPPPEGGWEAIGLADMSGEDPDEPITTVELPDDHLLKQRTSPTPSQTTESSAGPDNRNSSPVLVAHAQAVHEISSDETRDTTDEEEEEEARAASAHHIQEHPRSGSRRSVSVASATTRSSHTRSSAKDLPESVAFENLADGRELQDWLEAQKRRYKELPQKVFKRLASIAMQSTNQNMTSATMLFQIMIASYTASETKSRLEHGRLQNLKKPGQFKPKPFKPRTRLNDTEAKALLPDDIMGVWTAEDDEALLSCTSARISRVHKKHTKNGAKKRAKYLKHRYGLVHKADRDAGPSTSATPATGSGMRKR